MGCTCGAGSTYSTFVGKEQKEWVSLSCVLIECGACTANILHDGHVDVQAEACLCMD